MTPGALVRSAPARRLLRARWRLLARGAGRGGHTLAAEGAEALERFERLAADFSDRYAEVRALGDPAALEPPWRSYLAELERHLLPRPPADFLRLPVALETMTAHGRHARAAQLSHLRRRLPQAELARLVREDAVGAPLVAERRLLSSGTRIQAVTGMQALAETAGVEPASVRSIVEWGGGYGQLARLWRRVGQPTYVLVDLPLVACLQWLYLASVLGEEAVRLYATTPGEPESGLVHVLPAAIADAGALRPELFVSTWGLSESPAETQRRVAESGFFGAEHLLVAFQRRNAFFPGSTVAADAALAAGARLVPVPGRPGSAYAIR